MSPVALLGFLLAHIDLIELVYDAVTNKGVTKEQLLTAVKHEMVEASDAAMRAELGS